MYRHMIACITPRPIAWVATCSEDGIANIAPFSFFSGIAASPATLLFSAVNKGDGSKKDTVVNIEATQEFVVHVATYDKREAINKSSAEFPSEESEFAACGLQQAAGDMVSVPHVVGVPVYMECSLNQIVHIGEGSGAANIIIGNILSLYIDDAIVGSRGFADPIKLDSIGRLGGNTYTRTQESFDIPRPKL